MAKTIPQMNLATTLNLKGIVDLDDMPNLSENVDPFMPSKGGFKTSLPTVNEPKQETLVNEEATLNPNSANLTHSPLPTNSKTSSGYSPGSMISFNTFNKGAAPVFTGQDNNAGGSNVATSSAPQIKFNFTNGGGAEGASSQKYSIPPPSAGNVPPPPPFLGAIPPPPPPPFPPSFLIPPPPPSIMLPPPPPGLVNSSGDGNGNNGSEPAPARGMLLYFTLYNKIINCLFVFEQK